MARYRIAFILSLSDHGGAEGYYVERVGTTLLGLSDELDALCRKRAALLGRFLALKALRITQLTDDLGAPVTIRGRSFRKNYGGSNTEPACETNVSLQARMTTADGLHSKIAMMAGMWNGIFDDRDTVDLAYKKWIDFWNSFVAEAQARRIGWLSQSVAEKALINGYVVDPDTYRVTYTLAAPGLTFAVPTDPQRVSVEFSSGKSPLDGIQIVYPVTGNLATQFRTAKTRPSLTGYFGGTMRRLAKAFVSLAPAGGQGPAGTVLPETAMSRRRGRPLLASAGRRGARPRA